MGRFSDLAESYANRSRASDSTPVESLVCAACGTTEPHVRGECPEPVRSPAVTSLSGDEDADQALVDELLAKHAAGALEPEPVELRPLPRAAGAAHRAIYADYRRVLGLRMTFYAGCDDRAVMYACRWVGDRLGMHRNAVSRALGDLVRWGILDPPVPYEMPGKPRPVNLYAPAGLAPQDVPGEVVGDDDVEPVAEGVEDPLVGGAVMAVVDGPLDAAMNGTGDVVGRPHTGDDARYGGQHGSAANHYAEDVWR